MFRWVFVIVFLLLTWYSSQTIRTAFHSRTWQLVYLGSVLLIYGVTFWLLFFFPRQNQLGIFRQYLMGLSMGLMVFQVLTVFFLFLEDIVRIFQGITSYFSKDTRAEDFFLPQRRIFISKTALIVGALPFGSIIYGMFRGKYHYQIHEHTLTFEDLPNAFDGFTITQISDLHTGSFDNPKKVAYGFELINQLASDIIVFTGDLVNDRTSEVDSYQDIFSSLKAKEGVYSVLGNHDYGDYTTWESQQQKDENLLAMHQLHKQLGWHLLLNESVFLERDGEQIAILGVENWGTGRFRKSGDLQKALESVPQNQFKILLSHDPSHWEAKVLPSPNPIHLTLSGHTHGMQFGIEIPGLIKWSPSSWRYKQWAGVYQKGNQHINVNRGFGYIGYPGRVGIYPEITKITLKRA
ncbi:MAG: metallophosphoesterase [Flavobacteriaceae bacterium]|nr:metallophosphoesterase [Flavobacteriaceae bacterium]MCY4268527.1 metallophosphoesterase [Flavobacteriaceae bacterium]